MTFSYVFTYFMVALVCALVAIVILNQLATDMGSEQEVHAFRGYIVWYLIFTLSNGIWIWVNYGYLDIPGWPLSMANIIAVCVASYYWFRYVELRLNPLRASKRWFQVASLLPLLVAIAIVLTTPFTGFIFHYEGNEYIHGPLYPTMAALAILYLVMASITILLHLSEVTSPLQRSQHITLIMFLVSPVVGGVIDILVPNLPVLELTLLFGTVLVYTNMLQSRIYNDVLTGLNNRRLAEEYLRDRIAQCSAGNPLYFFLGDADWFKNVNDQYGHNEGDRALRLIAQGLRNVTGPINCHVARWGGDEFVIIAEHNNLPSPEGLIASIKQRLAEITEEEGLDYALSLSIGYATCSDPHSIAADVFQQADAAMYESKRAARATIA